MVAIPRSALALAVTASAHIALWHPATYGYNDHAETVSSLSQGSSSKPTAAATATTTRAAPTSKEIVSNDKALRGSSLSTATATATTTDQVPTSKKVISGDKALAGADISHASPHGSVADGEQCRTPQSRKRQL